MSFFGKHPPLNALSNFDIELQYFYNELLSVMLKNEKLKKTVLKSLDKDRIRHIQKISSKVSLQYTAYIFRYGPCYTSALANYMLRMVQDNPFIFRDALWKRCVNICCFGNAVSEIVAICKIFSLAQDGFWECTRKPLTINVTVVGKTLHHTRATTHTLKLLLKMNNILDTSKMLISVHHLNANPAKLLKSSLVKALREADLVTMVKYVSTIRVGTVMEQFIWEVADNMKIGGTLFFLDIVMIQQFKLLQKVLVPSNDFENIYGPSNIEPFCLSIKSVQKSVELFWSRFQGNICLTGSIVNSCAWRKSESIPTEKETGQTKKNSKLSRKTMTERARKTKQEWCENVQKSQKALLDYHRQVRHIIPNENKRRKNNQEDDSCFFLDYPNYDENILFKSKSKSRRIYLDESADFSVA
uniref:Uncharacterized protein n=1 Tax=Parasteatoda tepidariorum TaxID=114398 RepID=A0A2L2Y0I7_PARTP